MIKKRNTIYAGRKKLLKRLVAVGTVVLSIAALTACGGNTGSATSSEGSSVEASSAEAESLNVGVVSVSARGAIPILADSLGYFKEEGLDVHFEHLNSVPDLVAALSAKSLDVITFAIVPELNAISEGAEFTFIAGTGNADEKLFVRKENAETYADPANLKGATIGTTASSAAEAAILPKIEAAGLSYPEDIEFVQFADYPSISQAIAKGEVDAGFLTPDVSDAAETLGEVSVMSFEDSVCCRNTVRTETIENDRSALVKYLISIIRAYDYYQTNHDGTLDILSDYSSIDKETLEGTLYADGYISVDPNTSGILLSYEANGHLGKVGEIEDLSSHIDASLFGDALSVLLEREPDNAVYKELQEAFEKNNSK